MEKRTWGQALGGMVRKASKSVLTSVMGAEDFENVRFVIPLESVKRTAVKMLEVFRNHGKFVRCTLRVAHYEKTNSLDC